MPKLLPRLESFEYEEKIAKALLMMENDKTYFYRAAESDLEWLPVGDRIDIGGIDSLRNKIISFARDEGISRLTNRADMTHFDRKLGINLLNWLDITPSMAADIGMWAYLNIILVPDLIKSRWTIDGKINPDRFYGNTRNYLGSLWWGAYLTSDESLYYHLSADEFVGWFERTSSRGLPDYLGRFINFYRGVMEKNGALDSVLVYRNLIKEINRKLAFINYFALREEDFTVIMEEAFEKIKESCITE